MVGDVVGHGSAPRLQRQQEGLAQAAEIPDVLDIRLVVRDGLAEHAVIVPLQQEQLVRGQPGMTEKAVDPQPAGDPALGRFVADAMGRGQDAHVVAARAQLLDDLPAAFLVAADDVRRIEIGDDKNFHDAGMRDSSPSIR